MADATVTLTLDKIQRLHKEWLLSGTLAIDASPDTYATGGLAMDFAAMTLPPGMSLPVNTVPKRVRIFSHKTGTTSDYIYKYAPGTTISNGKIVAIAGALAEHAAAAVAAAVSGDTIAWDAYFDAA